MSASIDAVIRAIEQRIDRLVQVRDTLEGIAADLGEAQVATAPAPLVIDDAIKTVQMRAYHQPDKPSDKVAPNLNTTNQKQRVAALARWANLGPRQRAARIKAMQNGRKRAMKRSAR